MKQKVKSALKYLAFFFVGLAIFWWIYRDQDIARIAAILKNDVNYFWIWISLLLGVLSHISRAIRWQYLIEPMGVRPGLANTFFAVMAGYIMNLVVPRMGELTKCGVLAKYEKISFARLIGTVVTERIFDLIMLALLALVMLVTQFGQVLSFLNEHPGIEDNFYALATSPYLISAVLIVLLLTIAFRKKILQSKIYQRFRQTATHLKEGVLSIRQLKNKPGFIFHTLFIWLMYYLMLFVSFKAFDFTASLGLLAGLTVYVLGSFGMVAPVQGGIGAWHFMTREGLFLYGIPYEDGLVFAFLAHGIMTLMIIVLGALSVIALPLYNRNR